MRSAAASALGLVFCTTILLLFQLRKPDSPPARLPETFNDAALQFYRTQPNVSLIDDATNPSVLQLRLGVTTSQPALHDVYIAAVRTIEMQHVRIGSARVALWRNENWLCAATTLDAPFFCDRIDFWAAAPLATRPNCSWSNKWGFQDNADAIGPEDAKLIALPGRGVALVFGDKPLVTSHFCGNDIIFQQYLVSEVKIEALLGGRLLPADLAANPALAAAATVNGSNDAAGNADNAETKYSSMRTEIFLAQRLPQLGTAASAPLPSGGTAAALAETTAASPPLAALQVSLKPPVPLSLDATARWVVHGPAALGGGMLKEKNWMLLLYGDDLYAVHSLWPQHNVLAIDTASGAARLAFSTASPPALNASHRHSISPMRGNAQLIEMRLPAGSLPAGAAGAFHRAATGSSGGEQRFYLGAVHSINGHTDKEGRLSHWAKYYVHYLYTVAADPPFYALARSAPLPLVGIDPRGPAIGVKGVVSFVSSIKWDNDASELLVSYGCANRGARLLRLSLPQVAALFEQGLKGDM